MPVCSDDHAAEIQKIYRAVADGEPKLEILHMIYELYRKECGLAPPSTELRIAKMCGTDGARAHG